MWHDRNTYKDAKGVKGYSKHRVWEEASYVVRGQVSSPSCGKEKGESRRDEIPEA